MMKKQKVTIISNPRNSENSFKILLNSDNVIISCYGSFGSKFRRHCLQFTRKIAVRNESRLKNVKTINCEKSEIEILKQFDSWEVKRPCLTKISNGNSYLKNREMHLEGKHFFKHFVSHYLKMSGGYEQRTLYI